MSKRTDIRSILTLDAGPIVVGQACEFDYSDAQACEALREEGYRVILANPSPAVTMIDPTMTDVAYTGPIKWVTVAGTIEEERSDVLLPTMSGQTALNCALGLERHGVLEKFGAGMIGASVDTIDKAGDRSRFDRATKNIGPTYPRSSIAHSMEEAHGVLEQVGFPCIIRPFLTTGDTGGGIAYNREEFEEICARGLDLSPTNKLLIDKSLIDWKERKTEVVRGKKDNCTIVCSIRSLDPMGVHTGDLITVAPAQTLAGKEYQTMRNAPPAVLHEIGVGTDGSNVQFGICPNTGCAVVIEMNPRVLRSSVLVSKAIGSPIAKIAAKLAVSYALDELWSDITNGRTPASLKPVIDYMVTRIPCFAFKKSPKAGARLTTQMKSAGEAMVAGRAFQESVQRALCSLEAGTVGLDPKPDLNDPEADSILRHELAVPSAERVWYVADVLRADESVEEIFELARIDEWLLVQIEDLVKDEKKVKTLGLSSIDRKLIYKLKRRSFSDACLIRLLDVIEKNLCSHRHEPKALPVHKRVDTCTAEFTTDTTHMYSAYEEECEADPPNCEKTVILDGGPNRIDQGIEFNYCCVHAALAMCEDGYETIMASYDPGIVPTDYDISDRLYFEPVTFEDVLGAVRVEQLKGVIVQYGGQTPLRLCRVLEEAGMSIIGTSPDAIDHTEDHECSQQVVQHLDLCQPANATAYSEDKTLAASKAIGYPLAVCLSYMLGERTMEIAYQEGELRRHMREVVQASDDSPALLDHFLNCAIRVDIDAICDGEIVVVGAIMQCIEQASAHPDDSACSLPPYSLLQHIQDEIREQIKKMASELDVVGLMNVQMMMQSEDIFIAEVGPCVLRIVLFVSKYVGELLVEVVARVMADKTLAKIGFTREIIPPFSSVRETMFPFTGFLDADPILGPGMKSTNEVMDVGDSFAEAFTKAQLEVSEILSTAGCAFISVREDDESFAAQMAGNLVALGSEVIVTTGTTHVIEAVDPPVCRMNKVTENRPHVVNMIKNDEVTLVINTTKGRQSIADSYSIRRNALQHKICYTTTTAGGQTVCKALKFGPEKTVRCLQDFYAGIKA